MNVGIVGLGKMGMLHTGILNTIEDVNVVSIAERESLLVKYIKNSIPSINVFQEMKDMLYSENLDLVYITTPASSHKELILECIKKKINFFVEKPLTRNLDEAKKIHVQIKNSNVINAVGYNLRFFETFLKTKSLLDSKILGEISNVKTSMYVANIFSKPSGWRFKKKISGGGVLLELGCHLIDLLLWYFGPISEVQGKTKSIYSEVEDFASAQIKFSNKISGELDTSWSKEGYRIPEVNIEIIGNNGKLKVNQDFIEINLKNSVPQFDKTEFKIYKQSLEKGVPFDVGGPEYTKEDLNVVNSVKKIERPMVNVLDAIKTQSVIQAIYDSANKNSRVRVEYLE